MEVKTSPPMNIKIVMSISCALEKTSISTVDMLETVAAETDVKKESMVLGLNEVDLGFRDLRIAKPTDERVVK